MVMCLFILLD